MILWFQSTAEDLQEKCKLFYHKFKLLQVIFFLSYLLQIPWKCTIKNLQVKSCFSFQDSSTGKIHVPSQCWAAFHHTGASVALLLNKAYWLMFKQVCGLSIFRTLCSLGICDGLRKPLALCCFKDHKGVWVDRFKTTSAFKQFSLHCISSKRSEKSGALLPPSSSLKSL